MSRIYATRHGRSIFNLQNHVEEDDPILGGQTNTQLAPEGEAAADVLGHHFAERGVDFDLAVSSELDRSRHTLHRILRHQRKPVAVHPPLHHLNERSLGAFEGKRLSLVHREFPQYRYEPFRRFRASYDVRAPGGEHYGDVEKRMLEGLHPIVERTDGNILIVSHKHSLRAWIRKVLELPQDVATQLDIPNTKPLVLEYDGSYRLIEGLDLDA